MKRFLMFLVIAIAVVSLGLTIYYFSTDNEAIYIKSSYLIVEKGDYIQTDGENGLLEFKHKSEYTTLSYGVEQESDVISYNEEGYYLALNGGESKIVITTNNRNYSRLIIDVLVCDGSKEYPYIIKTEEQLRSIGTNPYTLSCCYKLGNDIELTSNWNPMGSFEGVFDGNFFTISNMKITNSSSETDAGFISVLRKDGVIKNLFLTSVDINVTRQYVGAYVGTSYGLIQTSEASGTIKNNISGQISYTGGISGRILCDSTKPKIDRCGFDGTIFSTGNGNTLIDGGIVGLNQSGMVSESYYRGIVKNNEAKFGGIIGANKGTQKDTADVYDSYFYMKDIDSNTNLTNIGGICYDNTNYSSINNMVTGCYFGGSIDENDISKHSIGDDFASLSNDYLTKNEFMNKDNFITIVSTKDGTRTWNFNSVWEIPNGEKYPILNVFSSAGSTYIIDVSGIVTGEDITTAEQFYRVMTGQETQYETYKISNDIDLNPSVIGWKWGDANHPFKDKIFSRQIINPNKYKISNLTINNLVKNSQVGMVERLASTAVISGLIIENVTIEGQTGAYVGVIAGVSDGASIYDTTITNVNVNINGSGFGTFIGYAYDYQGHGLKNITAKYVDMGDNYFVYAGGFVGVNLTTITATTSVYNYAYDISLNANFAGGIVGANGGDISYTSAFDVNFNHDQNTNSINNLYSGNYNVFVGGISGTNETKTVSGTIKGNIVDVYANIDIDSETGTTYKTYIGGLVGYNGGFISRGYVKSSSIAVTGSHTVFAGGITGYNSGKITNSVVDQDSKIVTQIISNVGTTVSSSSYILNTSNCSIVGGLVGYDAQTSNSTYSIYQCASYAKEIKGYYAGGLAGISFGKIEKSLCGYSNVANGGVSITGYLSGGLCAVVAGGYLIDSYTFCKLNSAPYGGKYSDVLSVVKMEVSAMAGITVFALNNGTIVKGCYAVATFNGNGVSYGSAADLTGYSCGSITNCVYQNAGSIATSYGTKLAENLLKGSDGFYAFSNAIGSNSLNVWSLKTGNYPTLEGVDVRFPSGTNLPRFH